ncbi:MAG: helix-turn-helix transcriptional regulator [Peptococcaceae bacterium]|nr:helix-turn-helix transcriptional regulator [Peptococcaceae bacterium]
MKIEQAFGIALRKHRKALLLSQEELAHRCELDRTFISLLERGQRKPTLNTIFTISKSLNIKASELIQEVELLIDENKENSNTN